MAGPWLARVAWSVCAVGVTLLAMAAAFLLTFEPNDYRPLIENALGEALGREVSIRGDLELAAATAPVLTANDVTIGNPPWASRPVFALARRVSATIALTPLLDGRVVIRRIVLERVEVFLEHSAERGGNWQLEALTDSARAESLADPSRVEIGTIEARAISVRYAGVRGIEREARIARLALRRSSDRSLSIEGDGRWGRVPVRMRWRAGPLGGGDAESPGWPISGSVELGGAVATLTGRLRAPLAYSGAELEWRLASGEPERDTARRVDYALSGRVHVDEGGLRLAPLTGSVAGARFRGAARVTGSAADPHVLAELEEIELPPRPAAGPLAAYDRGLPLGWLDAGRVHVELRAAEVRGSPVAVEDVAAQALLADGRLRLPALHARVAGVDITGQGTAGRGETGAEIALELRATRVALDGALARSRAARATGAAENATLRVRAVGSTIGAAVASANVSVGAGPVAVDILDRSGSLRLALSTLEIRVRPGAPARFTTNGRYAAAVGGRELGGALDVTASGGSVRDWLTARRGWPAVELAIETVHRGVPLEVTARVGDFAALARRRASRVGIGATWGPLRADLQGVLLPADGLAGTDADVRVEAEDLAEAGELLGVPGLPAGPAALAGKVALGEGWWVLSDASIAAPGVAGAGDVSAGPKEERTWRGQIAFRTLDLTPYRRAAAPQAEAPLAQPLALSELYSEGMSVLAPLARSRLSFTVTAETLRFGEFASRDVRLSAAGDSQVLALDASLDGGRMTATADIDVRGDEPRSSLRLSAEGVPLAADQTGQAAPGTPLVQLAVALTSRGASAESWARSLNGTASLQLLGGRIERSGLRFLFGSALYQLLDTINPFSQRKDYAEIQCAGAELGIVDGVASAEKGIFMQTPELQIVGTGQANLATGELLMRFRSKQRTGVVSIGGIVNEFVHLTGTLGAPRVEISPERAARTGLLAAVTGGLSLLANDVFGRFSARDACPALTEIVGAGAG